MSRRSHITPTQALVRSQRRGVPTARMWSEAPVPPEVGWTGAVAEPEYLASAGALTSVVTHYGGNLGTAPEGTRAGYALVGLRASSALPTIPDGWEMLASWQWQYTGVVLCRRIGEFTGAQIPPVAIDRAVSVFFVGGAGGTFSHHTAGPIGEGASPVTLPLADDPPATVWARIQLMQNWYSSFIYDTSRADPSISSSFVECHVSPARGSYQVADDRLRYDLAGYSPPYLRWSSLGAWGVSNGISVAVGWTE